MRRRRHCHLDVLDQYLGEVKEGRRTGRIARVGDFLQADQADDTGNANTITS